MTGVSSRGRRLLTAAALSLVAALVAVPLGLSLGDGDEQPDSLTVPEGWRATQVYAAVDEALDLSGGSTERAARRAVERGELDLPRRASDSPEGYLFPATYPLEEGTSATELLSRMVRTANSRFERAGGGTHETVTQASLVQAEADTGEDMGKVARVIQNRIERGMPLGLDATVNYALRRSTLNTSYADTQVDSPYNTYRHRGLPPGPINNPGEEALRAVADPPEGDWLYFVTVRPGDTRFTASYDQHKRWVREFNAVQRRGD